MKVFAFEPSSRELNRLWKNLQLNFCNNISVLAYGLGDKEAEQTLVIFSDKNPGINTLPEIQDMGKREVCHFARLIYLLSDKVLEQARVCKIDVEGQELFVLQAMKQHMSQLTQCVFIVEISPTFLESINLTSSAIYQFFAEAGFQYQFGQSSELYQWDEVFFHPQHRAIGKVDCETNLYY